MKKKILKTKYIIEFLSMFIAVISAFALNNWNDNKRDQRAEEKILLEIKNGLKSDLEDIETNSKGHKQTIKSIYYFSSFFYNDTIKQDSSYVKYARLFREPILILNKSGYESVKNKGLEIIKNDSLRFKIVKLYEYDYQIMSIYENENPQLQAYYYYNSINSIVLKYYLFDRKGNLKRINSKKNPNSIERNVLRSSLGEMFINKRQVDTLYTTTKIKVIELIKEIDNELKMD